MRKNYPEKRLFENSLSNYEQSLKHGYIANYPVDPIARHIQARDVFGSRYRVPRWITYTHARDASVYGDRVPR